jgi:hypothetical protein
MECLAALASQHYLYYESRFFVQGCLPRMPVDITEYNVPCLSSFLFFRTGMRGSGGRLASTLSAIAPYFFSVLVAENSRACLFVFHS